MSELVGPDGLTPVQRVKRWEALEASLGPARSSVVPLYGPRGKRVPYHGGCGVVAAIGTRVFVLTAAHVHLGLEENAVGEILVHSGAAFVPANGRVYRTNDLPHRRDSADIAVVEIQPGEGADALRSIAHVVSRATVRMRPELGADIVVYGYPHRDANRVENGLVVPRSYIWEGPGLERDEYGKRKLDPEMHVTMQMDLLTATNDTGSEVRSPSPAGVSGSGMWRWHPAGPVRLEGVFIEARDGCFIGTSVAGHLMLIQKYNPEAFLSF